jgi:hypothetical protein
VTVKNVIRLRQESDTAKINIIGKIIPKDVRRIERSIKIRYELRRESMKEIG